MSQNLFRRTLKLEVNFECDDPTSDLENSVEVKGGVEVIKGLNEVSGKRGKDNCCQRGCHSLKAVVPSKFLQNPQKSAQLLATRQLGNFDFRLYSDKV